MKNCKIDRIMKKIVFSMLALVAGAAAFTSCEDQLDIPQKAALTTETYYQTDKDAMAALASAYENFQVNTVGRTTLGPGIYTPARVLANHPGDDVNYGGQCYGDHEFGGSVDEFRFLHTPEAINYHYKGIYLSLFCDNIVIEKFAEPASDFQKQAVAEARVLRAYNFFLLACYWGTPPFVDHTMTTSEVPTNSEYDARPEAPKSQQEYFLWVAQECEKAAAEGLIERKSADDKEGAYRVTKGFAYALAGKAYMFAGEWDKAKQCLKKVIDSGKYALVPGDQFMDQFHIQGDGSPEKIFEVNIRYNAAAGEWSSGGGMGWNNHSTWMEPQCFQIRSDKFKKPPLNAYTDKVAGWGSIGLPKWYADEFVENDGLESKRLNATMVNIENLVYGETGIDLIDTYYSKLPSMSHADKVASTAIGINAQDGHYGQTFWVPLKHIVRAGDAVEDGSSYSSVHRLNNIIIMRYAEVLLNYAECCLRTGDAATAKTYINQIQERAGSKTISGSVDLVTLKKEKSYEMWFEGCRYQDLLRWSKLDSDQYTKDCMEHLKKQGTHIPHLYDKLFRAPEASDVDVIWQYGSESNSRFWIGHTHEAQDAGFEVGWQEKHRLFPYPTTVLENNPELHQNPGWPAPTFGGGDSDSAE
jgi:tetratricopeptide (TPR) repeat protein